MPRVLLGVAGLAVVGAVAALLSSASFSDREYRRLVAEGDAAAASDQPAVALEAYSGAVALKPEAMLPHLKRGMVYRSRGELDAAARDLRRAVDLDPMATLPLELLGDTYLAMQRLERAAERYQAYLAIDDGSPRVWYKLGVALYRAGQPRLAVAPLERAVALDGSLAEAHLLLGLCLRDQNDSAGARTALEGAARLAPAMTAPREALAALYAAGGEHAREIDQLEALAALDPTTDRFVALGLAHARARHHEAAVVTLGRAVERFPNEPRVFAALGRVWLELAETRRDGVALKKALEALAVAANDPDVASRTLTDYGRARRVAGELAEAERVLRQATDRRPVDPDAYLELAAITADANRLQEARDCLVRYAAVVPEATPLADVAARIAEYSLRLGQPQVALRWAARAVDEAGDTPALTRLRARAAAMAAAQ